MDKNLKLQPVPVPPPIKLSKDSMCNLLPTHSVATHGPDTPSMKCSRLQQNIGMCKFVVTFLQETFTCNRCNSYLRRIHSNTVYIGYSDNGYSDIMVIVILLSLSIFPHLHIHHTKFIRYSDIMVIVIIWP